MFCPHKSEGVVQDHQNKPSHKRFELAYANWEVNSIGEFPQCNSADTTPGIMLPLPNSDVSKSFSENPGKYAVLSSDWKEMDVDGAFILSKVSWVNYDSIDADYADGVSL